MAEKRFEAENNLNNGSPRIANSRKLLPPVRKEKHTDLSHALPCRLECTCEASKHALINNCLACGRIVCEQEGSGPCFSCNTLVCTPKEQDLINRDGKSGKKLYEKLMEGAGELPLRIEKSLAGLEKAVQHKLRLLEFDKAMVKSTKVIDDEGDSDVESNKWLTPKQRKSLVKQQEELHEARHTSRLNTKLKLDFGGRQVSKHKETAVPNFEKLLDPDYSGVKCEHISLTEILNAYDLTFSESRTSRCRPNPKSDFPTKRSRIRIQDSALQTMSDEGMCLSLHQPYASLLVTGIKRHEGRSWYTCHRGRLWIHAAAKIPEKQETLEIENAYRNLSDIVDFPRSYPTGCILGCVDLIDCLPQEGYREEFSRGEIASPFVFICGNPQETSIKIPMKGKYKIFKMDKHFHQAAKKTLSTIQ